MSRILPKGGSAFGSANTGGAWLSSARVVRCWVKSRNEPTLVISCQHEDGHSRETAGDKPEEGGDDVKSACPLRLGLHTYYNATDKGQRHSDVKQIS